MITGKLITLIENHADELAKGLMKEIQSNPKTSHYQELSPDEMYIRTYDIYKNIGNWLSNKTEEDIQRTYMNLGGRRYLEQIPLSEVVFAIILTKDHLLNYVKLHGLSDSALDLHHELELYMSITLFIRNAIYYTILGYETRCEGV